MVIFSLPETHVVTHLQVASKLDAADKTSIEEKISETIAWLDANQTAEKEEFEEKYKREHPNMDEDEIDWLATHGDRAFKDLSLIHI